MAKKKKTEEAKPMNMLAMRVLNAQQEYFQGFLKGNFSEEVIKQADQAQLDLLYKAFVTGFNSAIINIAGDLLKSLDIDLNLTQKDIKEP